MIVRRGFRALVMKIARASFPRLLARRGTSRTCRDASAAPRRTTDRPEDIWRAGQPVTVWPSSRVTKSFGNGQRRSARRASTLRSARLPSPAPGRGGPFRLREFRHGRSIHLMSAMRTDEIAPARPAALWCSAKRIFHAARPKAGSHDRSGHPFRLPAGAARRQAGAGGRRIPHGRAPLRPDERPDVGRPAPGLEGRAGHRRQPAEERSRLPPARCRGRHRRYRLARGRGRRRRHPCHHRSTSMPICWRSAASARKNAASIDAITFVEGNAEALPLPDSTLRRLYDRIRHPQRAAHRRGAARSVSRAASRAGISSAWNSPRSMCRASTRSTTSIRSMSIPAIGRAVAGDAESYRYLVELIRKFPQAAGLRRHDPRRRLCAASRYQPMTGGIVALHSGWRL